MGQSFPAVKLQATPVPTHPSNIHGESILQNHLKTIYKIFANGAGKIILTVKG